LGTAERALNEPRNLTATSLQRHFNHSDISKTTLKITTKKREENNDKETTKSLHLSIASVVDTSDCGGGRGINV
jgi:hypothetical protein